MDDQSVNSGFTKIGPAEYDLTDVAWLKPIIGVPKVDFREMLTKLDTEEYQLWRLPNPAQGVAVSYPSEGLLFVYYLHGTRLFGSITSKNLLQAAHEEGLDGMAADTKDKRVLRILKSFGFQVVSEPEPEFWHLELR